MYTSFRIDHIPDKTNQMGIVSEVCVHPVKLLYEIVLLFHIYIIFNKIKNDAILTRSKERVQKHAYGDRHVRKYTAFSRYRRFVSKTI